MPIQTYQMLMQSISTRMQLWYHCPIPINQQSLSTLGAEESFFSELTQMEFTGLGCPKSVDVPRLMSYCAALNNIRHDPNRGFEFHTAATTAYPYHLLEPLPTSDNTSTQFDEPLKCKQRTLPTALALPKVITRGVLTVCEHHKKNEMKILLHKR